VVFFVDNNNTFLYGDLFRQVSHTLCMLQKVWGWEKLWSRYQKVTS